MAKILCVEDSDEVQIILKTTLGAEHEVRLCFTISEARRILAEDLYDLIVLDINLPDGDGLRYCSELKASPLFLSIPVFVLSGKKSIQEKTLGFQIGIEDYIVKPFEPIELKMRISSRLKKIAEQKIKNIVVSFGNIEVDISKHKVCIRNNNGEIAVELSSKGFKIFLFLIQNKDNVKTREQIIDAVWGDGLNLSDRAIDSHISRIRGKITNSNVIIEPIIGVGYRASTKKINKAA